MNKAIRHFREATRIYKYAQSITNQERFPAFAVPGLVVAMHARKLWTEFIRSYPLFDLFLTIGFRIWLAGHTAQFTTNHLLTRINRSIYGKRFKKHGEWLSGIGVIEFKSIIGHSCGSPHFHLLLRFPAGGERPFKEVRVALQKGADRLRYPTVCPDRPLGGPISGADFVDVRPIHDLAGLANYLTKELGPGRTALNGHNVFFVGRDGIEGLNPREPAFRF